LIFDWVDECEEFEDVFVGEEFEEGELAEEVDC
jgi:hypothetical protein